MHTTNYFNTFISVAEDCPVTSAGVPPIKGEAKSVANQHFEMIAENPYKYTSDEVIFGIFAQKNGFTSNLEQERAQFFSKGQACLRASPLGKRYGWGLHFDAEGRVAAYPLGSEEYERFLDDVKLKKTKAMRSKKA
jgi:hypothetical protein